MIYGYARVSTPKQDIERQVRNILRKYPTAVIVREIYTGRTQERPKWMKLQPQLKPEEDKIVFDSVSRMSRNSDEGFEDYQKLFSEKIELEFLQEPHIDTVVYRNALQVHIPRTGTNVDVILSAVEEYLMLLAKEQIRIAFDQAQKEVDDLRQRTKEGIETARLNGKIIGRPKGQHSVTEKEKTAKKIMLKHARDFGGSLNDVECMNLAKISRKTYYKYKNEILKSQEK